MKKKRVTPKQLTDFLRGKLCNTPYTVYIARELLDDEDHPLAKKDPSEFSLRDIFEHIEIEDDRTKDTSDTTS